MWPSAEEIERLQQEWTDQYVEVDARRPELARFVGFVGRVKTVNMNGKALVEFIDYFSNVGWYDVGPDFLRKTTAPAPKAPVVKEKPAPKEKPAVAKKPAADAPTGEPSAEAPASKPPVPPAE